MCFENWALCSFLGDTSRGPVKSSVQRLLVLQMDTRQHDLILTHPTCTFLVSFFDVKVIVMSNITAMAFTTYILLNCVLAGLHGNFHPQLIRSVASSTMAYLTVELLLLKLGTYLLSADSKLLDFIAYSGYKFIGLV